MLQTLVPLFDKYFLSHYY